MSALKLEELLLYTYNDNIVWEGNLELRHRFPYEMSPSLMIKHQSISSRIVKNLDDILKNYQKCGTYIIKAPKIIFEFLSKLIIKKIFGN